MESQIELIGEHNHFTGFGKSRALSEGLNVTIYSGSTHVFERIQICLYRHFDKRMAASGPRENILHIDIIRKKYTLSIKIKIFVLILIGQ